MTIFADAGDYEVFGCEAGGCEAVDYDRPSAAFRHSLT
jgi:hypothetical protein